jgi:hypothetical protein
VAPPFRSCDFEIHFGKGIQEHEEIFDVLRTHGEETIDGKTIKVDGTGAWKTLSVVDAVTGEVILERKFYKKEFDVILREESKWIDPLFNRAMTYNLANSSPDVDEESYEEIVTIAEDGLDKLRDVAEV